MNKNSKSLYFIGTIILVLISFGAGWQFGGTSEVYSGTNDDKAAAEIRNVDLKPFWKAWDLLQKKHVDSASTTNQDLVWGAIKGLASSYNDPYTVFMPPVEAKQFNDDISGTLEGVGMEVDIKDNFLTVVTPIKDSPAERAGVMAGDKIVKIDGKNTEGLSVDQAVKMIRGKKGTEVKITFARKGAPDLIEKSIIRDVIKVPTVKTEIKKGSTSKDDVFVLRLYAFNAQAISAFDDALIEFKKSGIKSLVLDLRGNPGGYLDAAVDIAGHFLPAGEVVVKEDFGKNNSFRTYNANGQNDINSNKYRIIVLVNGGSASASEILAGALQEHGVAKLVGTKTFGKGSVQELLSLTSNTNLKVTVARWLTPNGHNISKEGIAPDYEVKIEEKDITEGKDPQMEKALEIIRKIR
jgi:carboxyl-terminal processing protease